MRLRRRALWLAFLSAGCVFPALAQEGQQQGESGGQEIWVIANFIILVIGLGWLIGKNAGPFFQGRLRKIREDIVQGEYARAEAEKRSAEVDRRLANLDGEIAGLRAESQKELENERERMRQRTVAEQARINAGAQQEILAAGKTARAELRRYSAELAIGLAERKIRSRINAETQDALLGSFIEILSAPVPEARSGDTPTLQA
jgi:F-type H+-transporting ATPase subunit b